MEADVSGVKLELVKGDITKQSDIQAIVNAANAMLMPGGGVAGAIHRTAGPALAEECRKLAPIKPGEAVITGAYNLPNEYVIHCLGPVYEKDKPEDKLLSDCYRSALRLADENKITSLAFPSISTGIFGYPIAEASEVAIRTVVEVATTLSNVRLVRFVLFSDNDFQVYKKTLERILS